MIQLQPDVIQDAGVELQERWTWDEFRAVRQDINRSHAAGNVKQ